MILCFAATVFVSAALLFAVQPMIGKMLLPSLGGTPAVWNTCMVFFQMALLGGYAYAHMTARWLGVRRQLALHMGLLLAACLLLPVSLAGGPPPPTDATPIPWLLGRLVIAAGLPFFVVAASAPLLQRAFAATTHPGAKDPYFLYAASNAGSLLALLAYPLLIEPLLPLARQSLAWTIGYGLLVALTLLCGLSLWRTRPAATPPPQNAPADRRSAAKVEPQRIAAAQRVRWVLCALVPSSLLLGVTSHITTNLAAAPLLWVIPLATYLLTFVLVFARKPPLSHALVARLFPFVVVLSAPLFFVTLTGLEIRVLVFHLVMFFVAAMLCHGELVRTRPDPRHLTEFYLWVAVGGLCGGMLNALLAPLLFTNVIEYPLMMVAACALRPTVRTAGGRPGHQWLDVASAVLLAAFALGLVSAFRAIGWGGTWDGVAILYVTTGAACLVLRNRPLGFSLGYAAALLALSLHVRVGEGRQLHAGRNFFGVKRVVASDDGTLHSLYHGTTVHGMQRPGLRYGREPLAYYHRGGPFDDVLGAARMRSAPLTAGLVGLGAGALAAYAERGDHFTFYELDPGVADLAADPRFFTYLRDCQGTVDVVLGDARRMLAHAADGQFDLLVLDAYSSDAIPTHLLSREAMQLYVSKIMADGVLAFHITNRFLDLQPVLSRLAEDAGLTCLIREETSEELGEVAQAFGAQRAVVVVMARKPDAFGLLVDHAKWQRLPRSPGTPLWTDEYSSVLNVLRR